MLIDGMIPIDRDDVERTTLSLTTLNPLVPFTIPFRLSSTSWVGCERERERAWNNQALFLSPGILSFSPYFGDDSFRETAVKGTPVGAGTL